jgi:hypothetical protein
MLKKFFMPILKEEGPNDVLFQHDAVPSHFHMKVTDFLNGRFPERWFGRGSLSFGHLVQLTLVPFIFFLLLYIRGAVYVPSLANTVPELAGRTYGVELDTDISAGPHMVTSLK